MAQNKSRDSPPCNNSGEKTTFFFQSVLILFCFSQSNTEILQPNYSKLKIQFPSVDFPLTTLTLKVPNKDRSRRHFDFLLLSFEENKA